MEIGDGISSSLLLLSRLHFCPSTTSNPTRTKQSVVFARSVSSLHRLLLLLLLLLPPPLFVAGIVGRDPIRLVHPPLARPPVPSRPAEQPRTRSSPFVCPDLKIVRCSSGPLMNPRLEVSPGFER